MRRFVILGLLTACASQPAAMPRASIDVSASALHDHIATLSSDRFDGRAPGTAGEDLTVAYLHDVLGRLGLDVQEQRVPLVGVTSTPTLAFDAPLTPNDDFVMWSLGTAPDVKVEKSELVFVGYGIVAPERGRDDFKDVDVKGKTVVFLVGDPFGAALTYYGRWTYKYEIAAKKGAAAAIIIHESGPAGYGWNILNSGAHEKFEINTPEARNARVPAEGWITEARGRALIPDFDEAKAAARTNEFRPRLLGKTATIGIHSTYREIQSRNVVARLPGSDPKLASQQVMYSAHWDHFGHTEKGIFHGALDNASGVACLLETARAFKALPQAPRRSVLFTAFTAEESGLLGAKYYAAHPLYPITDLVANLNVDIMNPWGRTKSIASLSLGRTSLDSVLAEEAARQDRTVVGDPAPEKGYYFRSDHFELAKAGVPALGFLFPGADYRDHPPEYGKAKRAEYVTRMYHSPLDVIQPDWDLSGMVEDAQLLFRVGLRVANDDVRPTQKP